MRKPGCWLFGVVGAALLAGPAAAQWEVEVDPFAYMVSGYSGHIARQLLDGRARLQLGLFAADVPSAFHGEDDFDFSLRGVTLKADYFFAGHTQGWFVGLDSGYTKGRYRLKETRESTEQYFSSVGARTGYRFELGENFYVTPWVSLSYLLDAEDVVISGNQFDRDTVEVFPTVHLGWRF